MYRYYVLVNAITGAVRQRFEIDSLKGDQDARDAAERAASDWNSTAPHYGRVKVERR